MRPLLVLDLGNVLIHVEFQRFAARFADRRAPDVILATWCQGARKLAYDRGEVAPAAWIGDIVKWLGQPRVTRAEVAAAWVDIFRPMAGVATRMARFAERYELWLCSDTDPLHFAHALNSYAFLRRFDRYLLSFARGALKREPGAFADVAAQVASGRRVAFVDDAPANVEAARAAGVPAALFTGWTDLDVDALLT
jgi:FMN phosphatase YigB (HAD superfamily)